MKYALAIASLFSGVFASEMEMNSIPANSKTGQNLIQAARRTDNADDVDYSWVADYSIVFQGCHSIRQWNNAAEDEDDVRMEVNNLVRFRLCPTDTCDSNSGGGCNSGYGDYILSMDTYMQTFMQMKEELQEQTCQAYEESGVCGCDNDRRRLDEENCMNTCYANAGMSECIEEEEVEGAINAEDYMECAQYEVPDYYGRKLNDAQEEEETLYYIGPQCSSNGGKVYLSLFIDDTCTNAAEGDYGSETAAQTFKSLSGGQTLPYSYGTGQSLIDGNCYSAKQVDEDEYYDQYAEVELTEFAETIYPTSGKCEQYVSYSANANPNSNACQYLEGIKMIRSNGIIVTGSGSSNKVAAAFIGIFACAFILLGSYVYYLKSKLDRGRIHLSD